MKNIHFGGQVEPSLYPLFNLIYTLFVISVDFSHPCNSRTPLSSSLDCQVQWFNLRQATKGSMKDLAKRWIWSSQRTLSSIVNACFPTFQNQKPFICYPNLRYGCFVDGRNIGLWGCCFVLFRYGGGALLREMSLCISQALMCCWLYPRDGRKTEVPFVFIKDIVIYASSGENSIVTVLNNFQ